MLHVRDISHPEAAAQAADVESVLRDLGIDARVAEAPVMEVWNKIDRLSDEQRDALRLDQDRCERRPVQVSAVTGEGIDALLAAIEQRLGAHDEVVSVTIAPSAGKLAHWLHENTDVMERGATDDGRLTFRLRVTPAKKPRLEYQLRASGGLITPV